MTVTGIKSWLGTKTNDVSFRLILAFTYLLLVYIGLLYFPNDDKVRGMAVVDRPIQSMSMSKTGNHLFYGGHYVKLYYRAGGKDYARRIYLGTNEQHQRFLNRLRSGQQSVWVAYPSCMPWKGTIILQ
jgi:hypothetical protein